MATFGGSDDLRGAAFRSADLRGARFVECDLSGTVMRGVQIEAAEIDAPWLGEGGFLLVNGVDVIPLVEAELNRRFPGRELQKAEDPDGLRDAWAALERTWTATLRRVAGMPAGTVDASVGGEWSFAQTLRHLVHATDVWLRQALLEVQDPFHPLGLGDGGADDVAPSYDDVLAARAERQAMVRDFIAGVGADDLEGVRRNPHDPAHAETVRSCLHVVLEEEWEHHRYAVRDLDALENGARS